MISSILEENLETSYIYYQPNIISKSVQDEIFNWLECMGDFKEGNIGELKIDRLQKWYQTENKYFSKDWRVEYERWKSHHYCQHLFKYQNMIQQIVNTICKKHSIKIPNINSCLINMYRDGNDIIKRHSDNQTVFGENPTVVVLSLGQPRIMDFTRRVHKPDKLRSIEMDTDKKELNMSIKLESGSLLIMAGSTQKYYFHGIEKEDVYNKRYSMTWREYI